MAIELDKKARLDFLEKIQPLIDAGVLGVYIKDLYGVNWNKAWIGCDLDGTLADCSHPAAAAPPWPIGEVIEKTLARIRLVMMFGVKVRIFSIRAKYPEAVSAVRVWMKANHLPDLDVTCTKDDDCIEIWDDRAVQYRPNSGRTAAPERDTMDFKHLLDLPRDQLIQALRRAPEQVFTCYGRLSGELNELFQVTARSAGEAGEAGRKALTDAWKVRTDYDDDTNCLTPDDIPQAYIEMIIPGAWRTENQYASTLILK